MSDQSARVLHFYTETPLHAGSGSSVAAVDLPIQREKHTRFPLVQGSGIKGCLRERAAAAVGKDDPRVVAAFGPPTDKAHEHAGALAFTDARLLLFPVRSFANVFAWVTCPLVLHRYARDRAAAGFGSDGMPVPEVGAGQVRVAPGSALVRTGSGTVLLEDLAFAPSEAPAVAQLAQALAPTLPDEFLRGRLAGALAVVSDDAFRGFAEFSTEVVSRIRIDETGTVADGALWSEELLPSDSLLYCLALASRPRGKGSPLASAGAVLEFLQSEVLAGGVVQLGGDATVGRGLAWVHQS